MTEWTSEIRESKTLEVVDVLNGEPFVRVRVWGDERFLRIEANARMVTIPAANVPALLEAIATVMGGDE